jgi:hypothetical protein
LIQFLRRSRHLTARTVDQQGSQVATTALGDSSQTGHATGTRLSGHQAEPGRKLPTIPEIPDVADTGNPRSGGDDTNTGNFSNPGGGVVVVKAGDLEAPRRRRRREVPGRLLTR